MLEDTSYKMDKFKKLTGVMEQTTKLHRDKLAKLVEWAKHSQVDPPALIADMVLRGEYVPFCLSKGRVIETIIALGDNRKPEAGYDIPTLRKLKKEGLIVAGTGYNKWDKAKLTKLGEYYRLMVDVN